MATSLPDDEVISQTYVKFDVPSDKIVQTPAQLAEFIQHLPPEFHDVDSAELAHRLVTLRKKSRLPRLRRKAR